MFEILSHPLPTERIRYRKRVADTYEARTSFVKLDVDEKKKKREKVFEKNPDIGFTSKHYCCVQDKRFC